MKSPAQKTVKRLFTVSGNRCAFPHCESPLVEDSGTVTGEMAHIRAASDDGPRFDPEQSDEERHSFANLILLCRRHHKVIDSEEERYPATLLAEMKRTHEERSTAQIHPDVGAIAEALIDGYRHVTIVETGGKLAIGSPGAIQADTVNINTTKGRVKIQPPAGSIGNDPCMASYIEYLVRKYQDYQKQHEEKKGRFKYIALYNAIRREFGSKWQTLPDFQFDALRVFLHRRIDNTRVGRIRKKRGQKNYHSYAEHNIRKDL